MKKHITLLLLTASLMLSSCALVGTSSSEQSKEQTTSETITSSQESPQTSENTVESSHDSSVISSSNETSSASNAEASSSEAISSSIEVSYSSIEQSSSSYESTSSYEDSSSSSQESSSSDSGSSSSEQSSSVEPVHQHTFATTWSKDATHHWHDATCGHDVISDEAEHSWNSGTITTQPTCVTDGVKTYTCTVCGQTKQEAVNATGHTFATAWSKDSTHHWHAAICGHDDEKSGYAEHSWDEGEITTQPSCTTTGVKTYTCTVCGQTKEEVIGATHTLVHNAAVSATATADGNIEYWECSTCHKLFSDANGTTEITASDIVIPATGETVVRYKVQESNILHAWNWSISAVRSNLTNIKNAGYGTVQLSPVQIQKDTNHEENWRDGWWKLYQPLSLSIAENSGQSVIGTKEELTALCSEADALGINIIVDVVLNHLGSNSIGGSYTTFNNAIKDYEPIIYNNNLKHTYSGAARDEDGVQSIVQGHLGDYPDLMTEDERVQARAISLLKEYIDCGVSGFRFDAAKHIETPNDGVYSSQFWPNVINAINAYAQQHNKSKPYCYGEIMGGRNYSDYTPYMSIADWWQSRDLYYAVSGHNAEEAKNTDYKLGIGASKTVLWAESHDDYQASFKNSTVRNEYDIDKTYVIQASRSNASSLYLARPNSGSTLMGVADSSNWRSNKIAAANEFHNMYIGQSEYLATNNGCFINYRGSGNNTGVAIVNVSDTTATKEINVSGHISNGIILRDLVNGHEYTVANGKVTVAFTNEISLLVPTSYNPSYNPNQKYTVNIYVTKNGETINSWWTSSSNTYVHVWENGDVYYRASGYESQENGKKLHFTVELDYNPVDTEVQIIRGDSTVTNVPTGWPTGHVWNQGQGTVHQDGDFYYVDITSS